MTSKHGNLYLRGRAVTFVPDNDFVEKMNEHCKWWDENYPNHNHEGDPWYDHCMIPEQEDAYIDLP